MNIPAHPLPSLTAASIKRATSTLHAADPLLALVIDRVGPCSLQPGRQPSALTALVRGIVFQQLSGKAAATIYARLTARLSMPVREARAVHWNALTDEQLRSVGISRQKVSYLRDLLSRVSSGELDLDGLVDLPDEQVVRALTEVRGIGQWSAHMHLLFHMGRPDVWPEDDLGIRRAIALLDGLDAVPKPRDITHRAGLWRPYRSVACWYLWRAHQVPEVMEDVGW